MSRINLPKSNIAPFRKDKPNLFHFFFCRQLYLYQSFLDIKKFFCYLCTVFVFLLEEMRAGSN